LAIAWPLPITRISEKDRQAALVDDHFVGVHV